MITSTLDPVAPPAEPKRCNLLLHCGASAVSREELALTTTPRPTSTWRPISHLRLLQVVEKSLLAKSYVIQGQAHGLTHDGARYFGLLEIRASNPYSDYRYVVGVRNSHDMRFSAGVVAGSQVLVCDNLCFSGEIQLARKHTPRIMQELPDLLSEAITGLNQYWDLHDQRVHRYRSVRIGDVRAHDLIVRSVDAGVMANSYIPRVLSEWREPRHTEFRGRDVWSLQNAFTEVFKGRVDLLPERTQRLHELLDREVGLG